MISGSLDICLEGFSNAWMLYRCQRLIKHLEDPCPNVLPTKPSSYSPALLMWPQRAGLQNFLTWESKRKKMTWGRSSLFSLRRNISFNRQPLCWCSRHANIAFCYIRSKLSFNQDMRRLPKQKQSLMHSKNLHCAPVKNYSSVHMGDLTHLLSLALLLMEFTLEKPFLFWPDWVLRQDIFFFF